MLLLLAPATAVRADPSVLDMKLTRPPVVGDRLDLLVRTVDPAAPVSGSVTSFGDGHTFGTSACRAPDDRGRFPGAPFAAGAPVTIASPHSFTTAGDLTGLVRLDSGGCAALTGSLFQPFTVTPGPPGSNPGGLLLLPPIPVSGPGGSPPPAPPGSGNLPPLPVPLPPLPGPPGGGPDLPDLPDPPDLPVDPPVPLPRAEAGGAVPARAACRGARRKVRRGRRARRQARRAVLCLLNRERRARGMRPLRSQRRLFTASLRHSRAMVKGRFFAHVAPGGIGLVTRLLRARYLPKHGWLVGENIAWGTGSFSTPRNIVRAWMNSTGHRANILNKRFREIGLGVHRGNPTGSVRGATFTTDFGFRR